MSESLRCALAWTLLMLCLKQQCEEVYKALELELWNALRTFNDFLKNILHFLSPKNVPREEQLAFLGVSLTV